MLRKTLLFIACFLMMHIADMSAKASGVEKYYHLDADKIVEYVQKKQGRRAVVLYASWCGYCRMAMPQLIDIERQKKGSIIAISTDQNIDSFLNYMDTLSAVPFHPIIWKRVRVGLKDALEEVGIQPTSGIPFTALIDEDGSIFKQGNLSMEDIEAFLL